jgi:hypothetical protein
MVKMVTPSKETILNNKIEFYHKNVFYYELFSPTVISCSLIPKIYHVYCFEISETLKCPYIFTAIIPFDQ